LQSDYDRPETIEETAELVTSLGGKGIAIIADHLDPTHVRSLSEQIRDAHGHIDILVNDIWGAEQLKGGPADWNKPIWQLDLSKGLRILRLGIDTHLITSRYLLPLLIKRPGGLLVEVTDGTLEYNASHYRLSVFYDLAKVAVNRLAFSLGHELAAHQATAVAITPGWIRSEMMLDAYNVSEENWRTATAPPGFAVSESPRYVGRAVVAIATDPARARWNQHSVTSGQLAAEYGFTDIDGSRPDVWRYERDVDAGRQDINPNDYR
jgi:NAD(P)-dependent dehydrogenase (short-subunit alcohol dehydrogenase family)